MRESGTLFSAPGGEGRLQKACLFSPRELVGLARSPPGPGPPRLREGLGVLGGDRDCQRRQARPSVQGLTGPGQLRLRPPACLCAMCSGAGGLRPCSPVRTGVHRSPVPAVSVSVHLRLCPCASFIHGVRACGAPGAGLATGATVATKAAQPHPCRVSTWGWRENQPVSVSAAERAGPGARKGGRGHVLLSHGGGGRYGELEQRCVAWGQPAHRP